MSHWVCLLSFLLLPGFFSVFIHRIQHSPFFLLRTQLCFLLVNIVHQNTVVGRSLIAPHRLVDLLGHLELSILVASVDYQSKELGIDLGHTLRF